MNGDGDRWEQRVHELWSRVDALTPEALVAAMDQLAAERPADDAAALFERAGARDTVGRESDAEPLYRAALSSGRLDPHRRRRAAVQLGSTLRNLGRLPESETLLREELARAEADTEDPRLRDELRAFLALTLLEQGRGREATGLALSALAPHLTRYQRSLTRYAHSLLKDP